MKTFFFSSDTGTLLNVVVGVETVKDGANFLTGRHTRKKYDSSAETKHLG